MMETKEDDQHNAVAAVVNDSSSPTANRNLLKAHRQESMLFNLQADRPDYFQNLRRGSTTNLRLEEHVVVWGGGALSSPRLATGIVAIA